MEAGIVPAFSRIPKAVTTPAALNVIGNRGGVGAAGAAANGRLPFGGEGKYASHCMLLPGPPDFVTGVTDFFRNFFPPRRNPARRRSQWHRVIPYASAGSRRSASKVRNVSAPRPVRHGHRTLLRTRIRVFRRHEENHRFLRRRSRASTPRPPSRTAEGSGTETRNPPETPEFIEPPRLLETL